MVEQPMYNFVWKNGRRLYNTPSLGHVWNSFMFTTGIVSCPHLPQHGSHERSSDPSVRRFCSPMQVQIDCWGGNRFPRRSFCSKPRVKCKMEQKLSSVLIDYFTLNPVAHSSHSCACTHAIVMLFGWNHIQSAVFSVVPGFEQTKSRPAWAGTPEDDLLEAIACQVGTQGIKEPTGHKVKTIEFCWFGQLSMWDVDIWNEVCHALFAFFQT